MNFRADPNCIAAAIKAADNTISEQDVRDAFQRLEDFRQRKAAKGEFTDLDAATRKFAAEEAERTRIAAAFQRRNSALLILTRSKQLEAIRSQVGEGRTRAQGLSAALLGTQAGVRFGRKSVVAVESAFLDKYVDAGLFADVMRDRPHIQALLESKEFDKDVTIEMSELKKGGNPGVTGNADAKYMAQKLAEYYELSRTDANKRGASIGKLDGYFGAQTHDPNLMLKVPARTWAEAIFARLDIERTFPEAPSRDEVMDVLEESYYRITTGFVSNKSRSKDVSGRVHPASLAKALGKDRVYHFKSVDDALSYRAEFGFGNTIESAFHHLRRMARVNAAMESFGPNPEYNIGQIVIDLKNDIKNDAKLSHEEKVKQTAELDDTWGTLQYGIDAMTGIASAPKNVNFARIMGEVRTLQSVSKLGSMIFSQIGDTVTPAIAAAFRGNNGLAAWGQQLAALSRGRPKGEVQDITFLLGEGGDGLMGNIINAHAADDVRIGRLSKQAHNFFKWAGSNWWTDVQRGAAVRVISSEMAMHAQRSDFASLPPAYSHFLGLHGIDAAKWEAIRSARQRVADGRSYITPDRVNELPDAAIEPLVADRLAEARKSGSNELVASIIDGARDELVMDVRRLFADETNYSVLQPDAATRRFSTLGYRPGTPGGEVMRLLFQFKSYPIAFTQRVLGRAVYGRRKGASAGETGNHIGTLIAGLLIAGYLAMTAKDMGKGYWPPRDPADWRTWTAALLQSGAAGIYGDFIFGEKDRFGGGLAETLLGPTIGGVINGVEIAKDARDFALSGAEDPMSGSAVLNFALSNNPIWPLNLYMTRPALDFLVLNSLREALSPGYTRRQIRNRERDYGQTRAAPLGPSKDPFNLTSAF